MPEPTLIPDPLTPAEQVAELLVSRVVVGTYSQLRRTFVDAMKAIWQNPRLSPEAVFKALGTRAVSVLKASDALLAALEAVKPGTAQQLASLLPAGVSLTRNPDGTVTVVRA